MKDERHRPKRKYIPMGVRRESARNQGGICGCGCGIAIWADAKETKSNCDWDHEPALRLRNVNRRRTDYVPAQLDPRYIVARCPSSHDAKTHGTGATTAGTDTGKIKKERKRDRAPKPKRQWQSRGFDKTKTKGFDGKVRDRK